MDITLNKKVFLAMAKKQHARLKQRDVAVKLSDLQESLAYAFSAENLATIYAAFKADENAKVDPKPFKAQTSNLFVLTWTYNPDDEKGSLEDIPAIFAPGVTLDDVASTDIKLQQKLHDGRKFLPEGFTFSSDTVALENWATVPCVSKYGVPASAHDMTVTQWVRDNFGYRVPVGGVIVELYDTGDDSSAQDHLLVWLNDTDAERVRAMYQND